MSGLVCRLLPYLIRWTCHIRSFTSASHFIWDRAISHYTVLQRPLGRQRGQFPPCFRSRFVTLPSCTGSYMKIISYINSNLSLPSFQLTLYLLSLHFIIPSLFANCRGRFPQLTSFRIRTRLQLSHSFLFPHLMLFFGAVYPFCLSTLPSIFHPNFHHFFS